MRAEFALSQLENKVKNSGVDEKLATFIVGMPNMILSNGLGQSLAFLMAKSSKTERKFVFDVIKKYLTLNYKDKFSGYNDNFDFISKFNTIPQGDYLKIQDEVLRMLEWLKRYARAFEKQDKKEKD